MWDRASDAGAVGLALAFFGCGGSSVWSSQDPSGGVDASGGVAPVPTTGATSNSQGGSSASGGAAPVPTTSATTGNVAGAAPSGSDMAPPPSYETENDDASTAGTPPNGGAFFWSHGIANWFFVTAEGKSGDGLFDDVVPPRGTSAQACHSSGTNFSRGEDLFVQLDHPENRAIDLSAYTAVAFWARLTSPSGKLVVLLNGGFGYFKADPNAAPHASQTLEVSPAWQEFVLPFEDFGADAPFVSSIDFLVGDGGEAFDLWIDDLAFQCRGACPAR